MSKPNPSMVHKVVTFTAPATAEVVAEAAGELVVRDAEGRCWHAPAEACRVVEGEG